MYFFSSESKNLVKNLNSLDLCQLIYHLYTRTCNNLFRLPWENAGFYCIMHKV